MNENAESAGSIAPTWRPLKPAERRILGVLVEKAKTTPGQYPMSLNALKTGCNQKSNRDPHMNLSADQVEEVLETLRRDGAVAEVQGDSRVPKYRHYMKDWLGVDGDELAVMAELLLRGAQTVGELRGRAARMAKGITDVATLRPLLASLREKGLLVALTPEGRGQVVTHALYQPDELERIKAKHGGGDHALSSSEAAAPVPPQQASPAVAAPLSAAETAQPQTIGRPADIDELRREVESLREEVSRLKREIEDIWSNLR